MAQAIFEVLEGLIFCYQPRSFGYKKLWMIILDKFNVQDHSYVF